MTTPTRVLQIATAELGYTESPPGSNGNKFGQWYGMNYVPWCAIFVSYCFDRAGLTLPIRTPKGFAYCPDGVVWFRNRGQWFLAPQVGDLVFYSWQQDGIADHIGIVETINSDGGLLSIEGNTAVGNDSNGGEVMRRRRERSGVLGFGRPYQAPDPGANEIASQPVSGNRPAPSKPPVPPVSPDYHTQLIDRLLGKDK
ncbi:MAG: CHAP domain-containing protein [Oscillatoriales cyanobacterium RM2_1_1]|nr:CHAP domain-containing protein [Oscillatoriales cyanobacterium RM2_1_1]